MMRQNPKKMVCVLAALALMCTVVVRAAEPETEQVPGVVIDHSPAGSGKYIGSPSLAVLPDGTYVASHDFFGPEAGHQERATTAVFRSGDAGRSWEQISTIDGQFWSTLFVHRGDLYIIGPMSQYGPLIIRRSTDGGETWTEPQDASHGLLRQGRWHTAPVPVKKHDDRLWRAVEKVVGDKGWPRHFRATVISAPADANLLKADNWRVSETLEFREAWMNERRKGWLEGNAVVTPDGDLVNMLRVHNASLAAMVRVGPEGRELSFDPERNFVPFPGGATKFTIRRDPESGRYWTLANPVLERHAGSSPASTRNAVVLMSSKGLRRWRPRSVVVYHPDTEKHGFQYPDWHFDGDDIVAVSRTAYDDGLGGAHNYHDANFMTFHRIEDFRSRTMEGSEYSVADVR